MAEFKRKVLTVFLALIILLAILASSVAAAPLGTSEGQTVKVAKS